MSASTGLGRKEMGSGSFAALKRAITRASAAVLLLSQPTAGWAQTSHRTFAVIGEIEGSESCEYLRVELRSDDVALSPVVAFVSPSCEFEFYRVQEGPYELVLTNVTEDVIHREYVMVGEGTDYLKVRLQKKAADPVPAGTISVQQLERKIPRRAVKEYQASLGDVHKGDPQQAVAHLAKALAVAPDYMEAHNELGVCDLMQRRLDAAAEEFQTAASLDPGAQAPASNLSVVLFMLKRYSAAEVAARNALRLNPAFTKARFVLGMSLHAENQFSKEMLEDLKRVEDEFPQARLAMADALAQLGRKAEAVLELKQYLAQTSGTQNRQEVEAWFEDLQRSRAASSARNSQRSEFQPPLAGR